MLEGAVDHVRDGLETPMGVPGGPLGLARGVLDLAHLVHVDEGVQVRHGDTREGSADGEALALEPRRSIGDALHRTHDRAGRRLDLGQHQIVGNGHCGHGSLTSYRELRAP